MEISSIFLTSCHPAFKNSHTKDDTEPSWHVIFGISSVVRNQAEPILSSHRQRGEKMLFVTIVHLAHHVLVMWQFCIAVTSGERIQTWALIMVEYLTHWNAGGEKKEIS